MPLTHPPYSDLIQLSFIFSYSCFDPTTKLQTELDWSKVMLTCFQLSRCTKAHFAECNAVSLVINNVPYTNKPVCHQVKLTIPQDECCRCYNVQCPLFAEVKVFTQYLYSPHYRLCSVCQQLTRVLHNSNIVYCLRVHEYCLHVF